MKLFVWDFHGVLEKGNERAALETSNLMLEQFGYTERFTEDEAATLYGRKWYEYFEYLLPNASHDEHLALQAACVARGLADESVIRRYIKPNDHAYTVLDAIGANHEQILISNTGPEAMVVFLDAVVMTDYFVPNRLFTANAHTHKSRTTKSDLLRHYVAGKNAVGGTSYLYTHKPLPFRPCNASYCIRDLRQVLKEV